MYIEKQVVEAKPRKLTASWTLEKPEEWHVYNTCMSKSFLKAELESFGLKVRWFGLESKKSMVKRCDNALSNKMADSIREEIDEMLLQDLIKEVNK